MYQYLENITLKTLIDCKLRKFVIKVYSSQLTLLLRDFAAKYNSKLKSIEKVEHKLKKIIYQNNNN